MKIKVDKIIQSTLNINISVEGITLLSVDEYEKLKENIKRIFSDWWLRSPGDDDIRVAIVDKDGNVIKDGCMVDCIYGVRPILKIKFKSAALQVGDSFYFGEYTWTVISDKYALCDEEIYRIKFRRDWKAVDANRYETSDVKKKLDEWFEKNAL